MSPRNFARAYAEKPVPASAISALAAIHGVVGHALFVGLAAAIVTRRRVPGLGAA